MLLCGQIEYSGELVCRLRGRDYSFDPWTWFG